MVNLYSCAVGGQELQIKKTSYVKVSSFLKHCSELNLLETKEENGVTLICSVQRSHDLFHGIKTDDPEAFKAAVMNEKDDESKQQGGGSNGKVSVIELHKLPKAIRDIFGSIRGEYGDCLRSNEVRVRLGLYCK